MKNILTYLEYRATMNRHLQKKYSCIVKLRQMAPNIKGEKEMSIQTNVHHKWKTFSHTSNTVQIWIVICKKKYGSIAEMRQMAPNLKGDIHVPKVRLYTYYTYEKFIFILRCLIVAQKLHRFKKLHYINYILYILYILKVHPPTPLFCCCTEVAQN